MHPNLHQHSTCHLNNKTYPPGGAEGEGGEEATRRRNLHLEFHQKTRVPVSGYHAAVVSSTILTHYQRVTDTQTQVANIRANIEWHK